MEVSNNEERTVYIIVIFGITRNVLRSRDMMLEKTAMATDKVVSLIVLS